MSTEAPPPSVGRGRRPATEADVLARLNDLASQLWNARTLRDGLGLILSATVELMDADMGSVRLVDAEEKILRIAADRGFPKAFLERFGELGIPLDSDWGRAARNHVLVEDVESDPLFAPFLEIARAAGYRALQSTPLIGRSGALLGILLTHFHSPHRPSEEELQGLDLYARQAAAFIERCRDEERLRENERRLQLALNASAAGTWRWNAATNDLEWDDAFHEHYGLEDDEPRGYQTWVAQLHDDDRARVLAWLDAARNGGGDDIWDVEFRSEDPDRGVVWHHMIGRADVGSGRWKGLTGVDFDVSGRRAADEALGEARERLAIIQQRAPFAISLSSLPEGKLVSVNDSFVQLFECTRGEAIGRTSVALGISDPDSQKQIADQLRTKGTVRNLEVKRRTRLGGELVLSLNADRVRIAGQEYVITTIADLSARRRAEEVVRISEARHEYLVALHDALRSLADPFAIKEAATRLLGQRLGALRAVYNEIVDDYVVIHRDYMNPTPLVYPHASLAAYGEELVAAARRGETTVVDDVSNDPRLPPSALEICRVSGVGGFMSAPLVKNGRLVAGLSVSSSAPRSWTPFEIDLLNETAQRTWDAVEHAYASRHLRENEERLRLALDASEAGCWNWNVLTGEVAWDERSHAQYGLPSDVHPNLDVWTSTLHPEDRDRVLTKLDELVRGQRGDEWNEVFRIVRPDGTTMWMHDIGRAERDPEGRVVQVAGIQLDITTRKEVEAKLQSVSERLEAVHDQAPIGIVVSAKDTGRFISVNDEFARIIGWPREEIEGKTSVELGMWSPEVRERTLGGATRGQTLRDVEAPVLTKTGEERITSSNVVPLKVDQGQYMLGIVRDVTDERRLEVELADHRSKEREQADIVRSLIATAAQGILAVGRDGIIVEANAALESMMGWERGALTGRPVLDVMPVERRAPFRDRFQAFWADPGAQPFVAPPDAVALRQDGTALPVELSMTYVPTSGGGLIFAFVTDVTERRSTDRTLKTYTRELEYRAHQLRRLASALTLAEQHANERLARRLHGHLQQLLASSQSIFDMLARRVRERIGDDASLLDFARRSLDEAATETRALARELFPQQLHRDGLAEGLNWQARWLQDSFGVRVNLKVDPHADPDQRHVRALLFESVRELLFNAVKHARVDQLDVELGLSKDDMICITVADLGVGFDPAVAFGAGDDRRTGLGLFSISERIALIGGRLEVDAAPGAGARFTLQVPRVTEEHGLEATASGRRPRTSPISYTGPFLAPTPLSVLIVDDHPLVRHGLRMLFEDHPELRIIGEATNGTEAVAQARALRPDAIVMDVSMPEMDGVEATRRIHKELPEIEILGLSAQDRSEPVHAIERAGAAGLFTKGQEGELLIDRLLALHVRGSRGMKQPT